MVSSVVKTKSIVKWPQEARGVWQPEIINPYNLFVVCLEAKLIEIQTHTSNQGTDVLS